MKYARVIEAFERGHMHISDCVEPMNEGDVFEFDHTSLFDCFALFNLGFNVISSEKAIEISEEEFCKTIDANYLGDAK